MAPHKAGGLNVLDFLIACEMLSKTHPTNRVNPAFLEYAVTEDHTEKDQR